MNESAYTSAMLVAAQTFEVIAAAVLMVGLVLAFALAIRAYRRDADGKAAYRVLRQTFGGVILLGLEIEIEGVPPWRRGLVSGVTVIKNAAQAPSGQ